MDQISASRATAISIFLSLLLPTILSLPVRSVAQSRTQIIGLVYDKNSGPGDRVSMSLTTEPKKYDKIPGLGVIEVKLPLSPTSTDQTSLTGIVVDTGDGRLQRGDRPVTIEIPSDAERITLAILREGTSTRDPAKADISLSRAATVTPAGYRGPGDFSTPPVITGTSFITGPFSNTGEAARVFVGEWPANVIAVTPRSLFFDTPAEVPPGRHELIVENGDRWGTFPVTKLGINGRVDRPSLLRGETTPYTVTVNVGDIPKEVWARGGSLAELTNAAELNSIAPGFKIPKSRERGVILLTIINASRDVVSIQPSRDERVVLTLGEDDFRDGEFATTGTVESKRSGSFKLDLIAVGFFAPVIGGPSTLRAGLADKLKKKVCPDLCTKGTVTPGQVEIATTPKGFKPGDISEMAAGVKIIKNVPVPGPGKAIKNAAAKLIGGAFEPAEKIAKRGGTTIWVRLSCKVCELAGCLWYERLADVDKYSDWEKVLDLVVVTKDGGGSTADESLTAAQIDEKIQEVVKNHKCP